MKYYLTESDIRRKHYAKRLSRLSNLDLRALVSAIDKLVARADKLSGYKHS